MRKLRAAKDLFEAAHFQTEVEDQVFLTLVTFLECKREPFSRKSIKNRSETALRTGESALVPNYSRNKLAGHRGIDNVGKPMNFR